MIGIVILNYKTWEDTIACIESIQKTTNCNYKIYVVDNKSPDDSYKQLQAALGNNNKVTLIEADRNGGYSAGNNVGIKLALNDGAEAVLLSNSDIIFYENSIDIINEYIKKNPQVGIVGPKVILQDGRIQHFVRENYTFYNYIFSKKPFVNLDFFGINNKTMNKNYKYEKELQFSGILSGCCIALTKNYFKKCGLLDENVFLYYEEAIMSYKAQKYNLLTCLLPESKVLHKSSVSIGNKQSAFSRYHRYYSSMYFLRKYVKINILEYSLVFIINFMPFLINSINKKEYRKMLKTFIKESKRL
ncbi:glycosyltransferase family 2 protein [Schinkia azotoformans]|uniref:glycosyltransferase family 2 protein n=1 Tax=Schinkia azotoformans TaxID=1454 RepID=UPI002DB88B82|nr:glycosyltransferase family 2 protein [Schinkia azotoformans]MEC1719111.1 glycosyltransferase family 2 protein [Schinkia azotoformans]MED4413841.1 glycosyltransferase family 2 protein [Schinkia azotoformans]